MFRVLLAVDTDIERALSSAQAVLDLPDASDAVRVTLLHVREDPDLAGGDGMDISAEDLYEVDEFPESITRAAALLEEHGVDVDKRQETGDPADVIVDVADELGAERIVITGRKRTPVGKVLFGSVSQSVLLSTSLPVTVVGANSKTGARKERDSQTQGEDDDDT